MKNSIFIFRHKFWMNYTLCLWLSALGFLIMTAEGNLLGDIVSVVNDVTNTVEETAVNGYNEVKEKGKEIVNKVETAWDNAENDRNNNLEYFNEKFKKNEDTSVEDKDVVFKYYNKDVTAGVAFNIQEFDVNKLQGWRAGASLKIITHGWKSSDQSDAISFIRDEYLKAYDYNIITTNWSGPANDDIYVKSALKVIAVGKIIARLVNDLVKKSIVSWENVHFIGHGLGGQVMGVAGWNTEQPTGQISGLDPSTRIFSEMNLPDERALDSADALFVDIMHTAGGEVRGSDRSYGHADFYPNGGIHPQPGCADPDRKCSNGRAYEFFAESIKNPTAFTGVKCENWVLFSSGVCGSNETEIMGDQTPNTALGSYYLTTKAAPPFGKEVAT